MTNDSKECVKWEDKDTSSDTSGDAGQSAFDNMKGLMSNPVTNYSYSEHIRGPGCTDGGYCYSSKGSKIVHNTEGLLATVRILIEGDGDLVKGDTPMGAYAFLETGATCKDSTTGKTVPRYSFVDFRPSGNIPFLSSAAGIDLSVLKGLIPGMVETAAMISPSAILTAFSEGPTPSCTEIRMLAMDNSSNVNVESRHVIDTDLAAMDPCWFSATQTGKFTIKSKEVSKKKRTNPYTGDKCEGFQNLNTSPLDYSKLPEDNFIKIYYTVMTLFLLYLLLKVFLKKPR